MKIYCDACKKVLTVDQPEGTAEIQCSSCGGSIPVPPNRVAPGVVIGDFLIEKSLSHGGMGEVYVARQLSLDRQVALKVLQERFTGNSEYIEGLFREARAAAKITHPNIVQAYAVGEDNGVYYFAMELIRGETFKQILKRENILDFNMAAKVICEVAGALDVAWKEQKLVHQDIKPDNIMLDSNGFSKLADLGLARSDSSSDSFDAEADEVMGTPQYISPEQLTGVPTDVRSDIYSLGATFYHFVTGRFPYVADTAEEITKMHVAGNLTPPQEINPALPDALNAIIVKMMARHIEDRYQLPSELIADLKAFLAAPQGGKPALKHPGLTVTGALKKPLTKPAAPGAKPALGKPGVPTLGKPAVSGAKPALGKPGMPTLGKPAVPGAKLASGKPGMPALAKPAVPGAKPAAPVLKPVPAPPASKPEPAPETPPQETPAAPEVTQTAPPVNPKPVPEAQPPEKPAAAPATQETPVEKKADDDGITLAPETKRKKKTDADNDEKTDASGEENAEGKKRPSRRAGTEEKKKFPGWLKAVLRLLLLLLILAGLAGGFYFAAKKDKLPAKFKPWGEKALGWIGQKPDAKPAETETATPAAPVPAKPAEPEKPQTRPEYLSALEELQREFRNTAPAKRGAVLDKADDLFRKLGSPRTPEESAELIRTWAMYSTADEELHFASAREAAINKYEKAVTARLEAKAKEAQRLQKQKEDDARREQELKLQNAEFDKDQKRREAEIKQRFNKLKRELDALNFNLIKAVIASAESGDNTAYDAAMQDISNHLIPTVCDTIAEREEIKVFETLKRLAPSALGAYKTFLTESKSISARGMMLIPHNGTNVLVRLEGIMPDGRIVFKTTRGQKGYYTPGSVKERRNVENYLIKHTDLTGGAFYYNLLTKYVDAVVVKYSPHPFWTLVIKHYRSLKIK